jgi:hypothetical protein
VQLPKQRPSLWYMLFTDEASSQYRIRDEIAKSDSRGSMSAVLALAQYSMGIEGSAQAERRRSRGMLRNAHSRAARCVAMAAVYCRGEQWPSEPRGGAATVLAGEGFGGFYGGNCVDQPMGKAAIDAQTAMPKSRETGKGRVDEEHGGRTLAVLLFGESRDEECWPRVDGSLYKSRAGQVRGYGYRNKGCRKSLAGWKMEKLVRNARVVWMQAGQAWLSCPGQQKKQANKVGPMLGTLARWGRRGRRVARIMARVQARVQSVMAQLESASHV